MTPHGQKRHLEVPNSERQHSLVIDAVEAENVRLIFRRFREGTGNAYTCENYYHRAGFIKAFALKKDLQELTTRDIVERSSFPLVDPAKAGLN
jgi:hypothetical protein